MSRIDSQGRAEDCETTSFYTEPGKEMSKDEQQKQKESCVSAVKESRNQAKTADVRQSVLFLFLGLGTLLTRKWLVS